MASILSVDADKLKIEHSGKSYVFDKAGNQLLDGTTVVKPEDAKGIFEAAVKDIDANAGKLSTEVKKRLAEDIVGFPEGVIGKEAAEKMQKALKGAEEIAANTSNHKLIGKTLAASPDAQKFLSDETIIELGEGKFSFPRMKSFRDAQQEFSALFANGKKPTTEQVESLLIKHHGNHTSYLKLSEAERSALIQNGAEVPDVKAIIADIKKNVSEGVTKAEGHATEIVDISKKLEAEGKLVKPDAQKVQQLTAELEAETKGFKEVTSGKYGGKVAETFKANHAGLAENLTKAQKDLGTHLDSAAKSVATGVEAGASKGKGFLNTIKGWYVKSPELVEKQVEAATKSGKAAEEIAKISKSVGKVRWGGVIGTAAGLTAVYLATTGRNKGKHQQEIDNQRTAEPEVAAQRA